LGERTRTRRTFCFLPVQTTLQEGERKRVRGEDKPIRTIVNSSNLNSITRWRGGRGRMRRIIIGP